MQAINFTPNSLKRASFKLLRETFDANQSIARDVEPTTPLNLRHMALIIAELERRANDGPTVQYVSRAQSMHRLFVSEYDTTLRVVNGTKPTTQVQTVGQFEDAKKAGIPMSDCVTVETFNAGPFIGMPRPEPTIYDSASEMVRSNAFGHFDSEVKNIQEGVRAGMLSDSYGSAAIQRAIDKADAGKQTYSAVPGDDRCECYDTADNHPINNSGKDGLRCTRKASMTLWRIDTADVNGTRFCEECGSDAMESGLFIDSEGADDNEAASKFTLIIDLGNDAMQTAHDIAAALHNVARALNDLGRLDVREPIEAESGTIHDANGNTVGLWEIE